MRTGAKDVAVIGGGIAGLAVAIRLAIRGFAVTLFEANASLGGKIAEYNAEGFRWDMGPSVFTMPEYVDELFELAGEDPAVHFKYKRLDPVFQYMFDDGTLLRTPADTGTLIAEFVAKTNVDAEDLRTFFKRSKKKLELTDAVFLQRGLHEWKNYLDRATMRGVLNFGKVEAFTTMAKANATLLKNEKVAAIFNQYAAYTGSDPFQAPATLNLVSYFEMVRGAYYPEGGMYSIVNALAALAERVGVQVRVNAPVERIRVKSGRAIGIEVAGEQFDLDHVISNADVRRTYQLMPDVEPPKRILDRPLSSSVIVFYWGMLKRFPQLGLHSMFMSNDQRAEYAHIFNKHSVSEDPTVYLYVSSKANCTDAPEGCENWYVMVSVPHDRGQDWEAVVAGTRANIIRKLERMLGSSVESHIIHEHVLDPPAVERMTSSASGAVFGTSSNSMMAAFLRHPNFSKKVKHLYFCGGSVHPGSSIPLCLLSAKITARLVG